MKIDDIAARARGGAGVRLLSRFAACSAALKNRVGELTGRGSVSGPQ
jgi:hypothetical protein